MGRWFWVMNNEQQANGKQIIWWVSEVYEIHHPPGSFRELNVWYIFFCSMNRTAHMKQHKNGFISSSIFPIKLKLKGCSFTTCLHSSLKFFRPLNNLNSLCCDTFCSQLVRNLFVDQIYKISNTKPFEKKVNHQEWNCHMSTVDWFAYWCKNFHFFLQMMKMLSMIITSIDCKKNLEKSLQIF